MTINRLDSKHGDEFLARVVMRAGLGVPVEQHDDQSRHAMYDLTIRYPDGRTAAAEVISTREKRALMLLAAVVQLGYVPCPGLTRKWMVIVGSGARVKKLAAVAPGALAGLERDGVTRLRRGFGEPWPPELWALGAVSCSSVEPSEQHPPGFSIHPFPSAAWQGDGDEAVRACEGFLAATPDVPAKLLASGLSERHAVVVLTPDWLGPYCSIKDGAMPTAAPTLPYGVDCLWMVPLSAFDIRAVYWLGDGVWREVALTEEQFDLLGMKTGSG